MSTRAPDEGTGLDETSARAPEDGTGLDETSTRAPDDGTRPDEISTATDEGTGLEETLSVPGGPARLGATAAYPQERIGPYRLLFLLGEGGMGEVWVADQLAPVKRKVALKVIKAGMETKQVVARFELEKQALALMGHPAIAGVFDGGVTPEGRPYFVMEYVPGVSITEHCDRHSLSTEDRLRLFIQTCEGVQHAHQKAIIHRDLKPSNILVSVVDGKPQPKIIDFGIAKATGHRLTDKTLATEVGSVIGTPEYMSPEQADLTGQDIDTRTDIYSLGVILYQLLTGELPFGSAELRSVSYEELLRKLREVDPPSPSVRLAIPGSNGAAAARRRSTDLGSLRRALQGDLDAITMKALEKERSRRYGTATELAADVVRFLEHEPVLARAPSRTYRMQKYVRRHIAGVSVATVLVLLLAGFATMMTLQSRQITQQRDRANAERDRANAERDVARVWVQHVGDLVGNPRVARPEWAPTLNPAYVSALDALLRRAEGVLAEGRYPIAEQLARDTLRLAMKQSEGENLYTIWARTVLGETLLGQNLPSDAEMLLRDAYPTGRYLTGPESQQMAARACVDLARALLLQGKGDEAIDVVVDGLENALQLPIASILARDPALSQIQGSPRVQAILAKSPAQFTTAPPVATSSGTRTADRKSTATKPAAATSAAPAPRLLEQVAGRGPLTKHLDAGERLLQLRSGTAAKLEFQKALAAGEDPGKAWLGLGLAATLLEDPAAAVAAYKRAQSFGPKVLLSYNLACAQAQLGRIDDSLSSLSDAIDRGFADPESLLLDADLAYVRVDPRFPPLLSRARANRDRKR
ncbi:MAG TPA: serine/threonine-protein kinase [Myxococcaceae bacterium]|nr:serine/threonine-protein kinase [Myxococcaceae bacterium]